MTKTTALTAPAVEFDTAAGLFYIEETEKVLIEDAATYRVSACEGDHGWVNVNADMHSEADLDALLARIEALRPVVQAAAQVRGEL